MDNDKYQKLALRTAGDITLPVLGLGIAGEAGEVADLIKKIIGHNHPVDKDRMIKELGDVMWYIAVLAEQLETDLGEIMDRNIDKLSKRYPEGFSSERSIHRSV